MYNGLTTIINNIFDIVKAFTGKWEDVFVIDWRIITCILYLRKPKSAQESMGAGSSRQKYGSGFFKKTGSGSDQNQMLK